MKTTLSGVLPHVLFLAMPYESGESGISRYIQATLKAMLPHYQLSVYALDSDLPALRDLVKDLPRGERVQFHGVNARYASPAASIVWFQWVLPRLAQKLHQQMPLQAVFFPAGNRRLSPRLAKRLPQVQRWITVHDLAPMRLKKYDAKRQFYTTRYLPACYRREPYLTAISEQTAQDLVTLAGVQPQRIRVNPNGYEPLQAPRGFPETVSGRPFVLFTGRLEHPAKNHVGLVEAWSRLAPELQSRYRLIFVGKDWSGAEVIHERIAQYRASHPEGCIETLGFVDESTLSRLYRQATLYVQPSLYEGFGLPLLEAMAVGTPVLSSDRGALPEVGGDTVRYMNPERVGAMAETLTHALQECEARPQALVERTLRAEQRVASFSWDRHVQAFAQDAPLPGLRLMGQSLFNGTRAHFLDCFMQKLDQGQRQKVFFMNADCFNLTVSQPDYVKALNQADWRLPDGSGVALGARLTGQRLCENLNGTDLFPDLCELAAARALKVFFLGAQHDVVSNLVAQLQQRYPQLQIQGFHSGFFSSEETPEILDAIAGSDLLFVAMGAPLQERWIHEHWDQLHVKAAFGVGGLFDFYSGKIPRAPRLLRRLGLEWCWRLWQEPGRLWQRYILGNPRFVARVLRWKQSAPQGLPKRHADFKVTHIRQDYLRVDTGEKQREMEGVVTATVLP